jgi:hypothetical protein
MLTTAYNHAFWPEAAVAATDSPCRQSLVLDERRFGDHNALARRCVR